MEATKIFLLAKASHLLQRGAEMRNRTMLTFVAGALLASGAVLAQTTPNQQSAPAQPARLAFEVASIKPSAPLDMAKLAQSVAQGQMPRLGPHVDAARAEYRYMSLRDLMVLAYKVQPNQISGPDWIATQRFDIVAKLPAGTTKDQTNEMLQSLLEERFKLTFHRETKDHPVFALVVAKDGPKLKESPPDPTEPPDANAPLKAGETQMDTDEGPIRISRSSDGSTTLNMGARGTVTTRMDMSTQTMHMEASKVTMAGFAAMLTQLSQMGGAGGRPIVDMTGLKGNYQVALDFSLADLMAMARSAMPELAGAGAAASAWQPDATASEPGGASSIFAAVKALGLRLEQRKAPIEQLVIDHVERTPIEN
jgi:uncharacterized protein (TIGR03435 family)